MTKTKIKNLCANRGKLNKAQIVEQIQYYANQYINTGVDDNKLVATTFFTVLGLDPEESHNAFSVIIEGFIIQKDK